MSAVQPTDDVKVIAQTKAWLLRAVIGLNLCPFAKAVHVKNRIRYVVSKAVTTDDLHESLINELRYLQHTAPEINGTTLLIHPYVLQDFLDYNDFLEIVDQTIEELGLLGEIQVASFHPKYQFAGTRSDDIENCTNRSPYPILQLLRETSIEAGIKAFPEAAAIYENNISTLQRIGHKGWDRLMQAIIVEEKKKS
jgi:hypothetical protein